MLTIPCSDHKLIVPIVKFFGYWYEDARSQIGCRARVPSNNLTMIAYHSPQVEDEDDEEHHVPALSVGDRTVI